MTGLEDDDPRRAHRIRGQVAVASTPGRVQRVRLLPERPRACARRPGGGTVAPTCCCSGRAPGSPACCRTCWCPSCATRSCRSAARTVIVLNLAPEPGETAGFSPGAAPGRARRARPGPAGGRGPRGRRRRSRCRTGCTGRPRRCSPGRAGAPGAGRRDGPDDTAARPPGPRGRAAAVLAARIRRARRPGYRPGREGDARRDEQGGRHGVHEGEQGEVPHVAMTAAVKDELSRLVGDASRAAGAPRWRRCCGSRAVCTSSAAGSSSRPRSTPARSRAGCAARSTSSTATSARRT